MIAALTGGERRLHPPGQRSHAAISLRAVANSCGCTTPDGVVYTYNANDCSVGDLDGDGEYEIIR